jgi:hypothetical protein
MTRRPGAPAVAERVARTARSWPICQGAGSHASAALARQPHAPGARACLWAAARQCTAGSRRPGRWGGGGADSGGQRGALPQRPGCATGVCQRGAPVAALLEDISLGGRSRGAPAASAAAVPLAQAAAVLAHAQGPLPRCAAIWALGVQGPIRPGGGAGQGRGLSAAHAGMPPGRRPGWLAGPGPAQGRAARRPPAARARRCRCPRTCASSRARGRGRRGP